MSWLSNLVHAVGSALRPAEAPVGAVLVSTTEPAIISTIETDLHTELVKLGLTATEAELDAILASAVDKALHGGKPSV